MLKRTFRRFVIAGALCSTSFSAQAAKVGRAVETSDNVRPKKYPKDSKAEVALKGGVILNQSYLNTVLLNGAVSYFWSETWGFMADGFFAINEDKAERWCIEHFYNDPPDNTEPVQNIGPECGDSSNFDGFESQPAPNWGPAYVPIRELKYMITGNFLWNPFYGKQIIMLSGVSYFDLYLGIGGGIAFSDYYALSETFTVDDPNTPVNETGRNTRGDFPGEGQEPTVGTRNEALVGIDGRPIPAPQTSLVVQTTVGKRFHFTKNFHLTVDLKNFTLVGTPSGFESLFAVMGGLGLRF